jgi:hypothetical protein
LRQHRICDINIRSGLQLGLILKYTDNSKPRENEYGVDLDLVDSNRSLTHEQRLEYHQSALDLIFELSRARTLNEAES